MVLEPIDGDEECMVCGERWEKHSPKQKSLCIIASNLHELVIHDRYLMAKNKQRK